MVAPVPMKTGDQMCLTIGLAQIAPVWLDRERTIEKVIAWTEEAARRDCRLVAFGEALVPGYPFWVERTDGARFNSALQKTIFAEYALEAIRPEAGHLDGVCATAARHGIAVYLGTIERARDRGGHSLYSSLVFIDAQGHIASIHRKLVPTYEERLVWSPGDGHGLATHAVGPFHAGGLNCWENWMPLTRAALYAQGEDLHVAVWPGGARNTREITRFIALESRSYVASVSGLMRREDIGTGVAGGGGRCEPGDIGRRRFLPGRSGRRVDRAAGAGRRAARGGHHRLPARARRAAQFRPRGTLCPPRRDPPQGEPQAPDAGQHRGLNYLTRSRTSVSRTRAAGLH